MKMNRTILTLSFVALLSACTPTTAVRGNLLENYQLKEILPAVDTRDDVVRKIGSPTTISPFDDNIWYYMGQKTKKQGIKDPKITTERIVVVSFAKDGKVDKVVERQDGREDVPIIARATPAQGNDFTMMQQMMGNLGKFNSPKQNSAKTATGGR